VSLVEVLQRPLLEIACKTVEVVTLGHVHVRVGIVSPELVHQQKTHILVVDVQDEGGTLLENFLADFLVHNRIISNLSSTSVMLVHEVQPVPSEVDRLFVRFGLSVGVELLLREVFGVGFHSLRESEAFHVWATVAKEIDVFAADLLYFCHDLCSDEICLSRVGQDAD